MKKLINWFRYKILGILSKKWVHSPHDEWFNVDMQKVDFVNL